MDNKEMKERLRAVINGLMRTAYTPCEVNQLCAILADLEREDIPKPTPEDKHDGLKIKYHVSHADGSPCDVNAEYFILRLDKHPGCDPAHVEACRYGVLEYAKRIKEHLPQLSKDLFALYGSAEAPAEPPAQMICNHAGECKADCEHKVKHSKCAECESPAGDTCPLPLAVCVPWGEKVKHYSCTKCSAEREETKQCDGCLGNQGLRRNWTAKQPEPAYTCEGDDTHQDYATAQVGPGTPKNKDPFSFSTWCAPSA